MFIPFNPVLSLSGIFQKKKNTKCEQLFAHLLQYYLHFEKLENLEWLIKGKYVNYFTFIYKGMQLLKNLLQKNALEMLNCSLACYLQKQYAEF